MKNNIRVVDACMRMHNFIVDFQKANVINAVDKILFDEDCRRFLAVQSNVESMMGANGREDEIRCDYNGNPYVGGRPTNAAWNSPGQLQLLPFVLKDLCWVCIW